MSDAHDADAISAYDRGTDRRTDYAVFHEQTGRRLTDPIPRARAESAARELTDAFVVREVEDE